MHHQHFVVLPMNFSTYLFTE